MQIGKKVLKFGWQPTIGYFNWSFPNSTYVIHKFYIPFMEIFWNTGDYRTVNGQSTMKRYGFHFGKQEKKC